jgi:energy-coupling factor transport system substrate-specific component
VHWQPFTPVVIALIAVAARAVAVSGRQVGRWTTWDSVLTAVLAGVTGVLFWAWSLTIWKLLSVLPSAVPGYGLALRDLAYGLWFLAAVLVPYIVRRPGSALAAEIVAAIISALLGSEWGLTVLVSGAVQGGLAEVVFALGGYRRFGLVTLILAALAAAVGSWVVDWIFWYSTLATPILLLMLAARLVSAALLSGALGKWLGDTLAATGVLDNTELGRARLGLTR